MKLKEALERDEKNAHESVKLLLRKYERFRVKFHFKKNVLECLIDTLISFEAHTQAAI